MLERSDNRNAVLYRGLLQPEGPVLTLDGSLVLVEMAEERACLTRFDAQGRRVEISQPGGRPTGVAVDGDGYYWVAGGPGNSLVRLSPQGQTVLTIHGDGEGPFLFPNDLAFGPDGALYMTDSGMRPDEFISGLAIRGDFATARYDGCVFKIDPLAGRVLARLETGIRFTNGIAFDASGALFYAETLTARIYRHDLEGRPELFAQLPPHDSRGFCGPDGMAFGTSGNLYCAVYGAGYVAVVSSSGELIERLVTNGDRPTNVVFGHGNGRLLVTEVQNGCVEIIDVDDAPLQLSHPVLGGAGR